MENKRKVRNAAASFHTIRLRPALARRAAIPQPRAPARTAARSPPAADPKAAPHTHAHAHTRALQVSYYYDSDVGDYYYGMSHPMKPHRVRMAHDLIVRYGLYKQLQVGAMVVYLCMYVCI